MRNPAVTYAAAEHQGCLFWITCKWLKLLRKASCLQVIQNSAPYVVRRRQCDIWIAIMGVVDTFEPGLSTYLQIALPIPFVMQTAPGPHGLGLQGSGFSTHRWFKQTSPYWQSGSLTHSGPHPVMVSGFGIMPGTQLQMALPTLLTVQMVLGPQGVGWQGFTGALVVRLTKMWIGE